MPVKLYKPSATADHPALVGDLTREWLDPDPSAAEPVILQEPDRFGVITHVYVVWERWADLKLEVRGEIIMDAARRVLPAEGADKLTLAVGVTPVEADRLDLRWR